VRLCAGGGHAGSVDQESDLGWSDDPMVDPGSALLIRYDRGLVSRPSDADPETSPVSRSEGVARARAAAPPGRAPGDPVVALRSVVVGDGHDGLGGVPRLAWVAVWFDSPPDVRGPRRATGSRPKLAASVSCVLVVVVDALSGEALDARQLCQGSKDDPR
jgi:hypothetical protein